MPDDAVAVAPTATRPLAHLGRYSIRHFIEESPAGPQQRNLAVEFGAVHRLALETRWRKGDAPEVGGPRADPVFDDFGRAGGFELASQSCGDGDRSVPLPIGAEYLERQLGSLRPSTPTGPVDGEGHRFLALRPTLYDRPHRHGGMVPIAANSQARHSECRCPDIRHGRSLRSSPGGGRPPSHLRACRPTGRVPYRRARDRWELLPSGGGRREQCGHDGADRQTKSEQRCCSARKDPRLRGVRPEHEAAAEGQHARYRFEGRLIWSQRIRGSMSVAGRSAENLGAADRCGGIHDRT